MRAGSVPAMRPEMSRELSATPTAAPGRPFGRMLTAMVTPYRGDGALDLDAAAKLAHQLVGRGCDGLALNGTTGESPVAVEDAKGDLGGGAEVNRHDRPRLLWRRRAQPAYVLPGRRSRIRQSGATAGKTPADTLLPAEAAS